jgi:molecular chaperone HscB
VQPASDPFATLGLPRRYDVDLAAVAQTHRDLSRALHPDKFVQAGASERRAALARAVEVNEAWRVVRDPIRRAEALLALAGARMREEGRHEREERVETQTTDPEFLLEMLEQREALAEAKEARDLVRVQAMARAIEARSNAVEKALGEGFARGEAASLAGKLGELKFYRRFLDEVSVIEDELAA